MSVQVSGVRRSGLIRLISTSRELRHCPRHLKPDSRPLIIHG